MKTALVILIAVAVAHGVAAIDKESNGSTAEPTVKGITAFHRANIAYVNTNYAAAADWYQTAIDTGFRAGGVYYNLGNAWYRCGRFGKAIAAYRHAHCLLPRDSDVAENLATARLRQGAESTGTIEKQGAVRAFLFVYYYISPDETLWALCICLATFFAALSWYLFAPAQWLRRTILVVGACALVLGAAGGTHLYWSYADSEAVVVADNVAVRSGTSENATGIFVVNDGDEVGVTGREGGWLKIKIAEKNGWVPEKTVEIL